MPNIAQPFAVNLPNGSKVSGTSKQILEVLKVFNVTPEQVGLHYSTTKQALIPISQMNPKYLRNVILATMERNLDELRRMDDFEFASSLATMLPFMDSETRALTSEFIDKTTIPF